MLRQVRGLGTLVPEDIRWIPATTVGRVERIILRPGTTVEPHTLILELSNPTLEQEMQDAALKVKAAEAALINLRVELQNDTLQQEATTASIEADYEKAALQAKVNAQLAEKQLVSSILVQQAKLDADQLAARLVIAKKQLASRAESMQARLAVQQAELDQARAIRALKQRQVHKAINGPYPAGSWACNPDLRSRMSNVAVVVEGTVTRIDPSVQNGTVTVDVALTGPLPKGARPDLSVDGTIELERLPDVLYVGRPAFGQEKSTVGLFRLQPGGSAARVPVTLGVSSVNTVEVRSGLAIGDQVILSDMSAWDSYDRVRLN